MEDSACAGGLILDGGAGGALRTLSPNGRLPPRSLLESPPSPENSEKSRALHIFSTQEGPPTQHFI